jgi:hypothetical protein
LWQVAYPRVNGFFGFGIEQVIVQVIGVEVGFDGLEIRHAFLGYSVSVFSAAVLKVFMTAFCNFFCI